MSFLIEGITSLTWQQVVMWGVGALLIYLAIAKDFEPALLLPMGFGAILVNIPNSGAITQNMPVLGFDLKDAASIGIIGAADGPTSILVSNIFNSNYIGAIAVAAYSYMSLVPIIQPFAVRLVTTKKERMIRMQYNPSSVSKTTKILFPILVTLVAGLVASTSAALVGMLMFGNLIRECGALDRLSETAQKEFANIITLLLGITIAASMRAEAFVSWQTLMILGLGLIAFIFDTIGGTLFAKVLNLFLKEKINPMVGAAGISAFPMSARVIQKMAQKEDPTNHLLMHAVGANVAGQISSAVVGGIILALVPLMLV